MPEENNLPIVAFQDVDIVKEDNLILSGVTLDIYKSDFVYLIGKVGTGKTSIIKTIIGDIPVNKGDAFVSGFNLKKLKSKHIPSLRKKIGVVFQDFQLLTDRSIYENLKFVLLSTGWKDKSIIESIINSTLESVGLQLKAHKMPYQLSGGEQQRAAIARALLNNPEIILADEPTGNLDADTAAEIMDLLIKIHRNQGAAVIIVTHNKTLLQKYPGRVFVCDNMSCEEIQSMQEIDFSNISEDESRFIDLNDLK